MLITITLGAFLYRQFNINIDIWIIGFALLGSLLPDVDHPSSMLGRYLIIGGLLFGGHRNKSHTALFGLIVAAFIAIFNIDNSIVFLIAFLLHILADITTKSPIPVAYPISNKKVSLGWFKTNGVEENLIALGCIAYILL